MCTTTEDDNTRKHQVGQPTVALTDTNRMCGDNSIKTVMCDASNNISLPHRGYAGVKVYSRFELLSWFVDHTFANPYAGVSNDSTSDGNVGSNNNVTQNQGSHTHINHEKLPIDYTSTAAILKQVEQGKGNACMRKVKEEKLKDKCLNLKRCIAQQCKVFGFLAITNLKRTKINTNSKPNHVLTAEQNVHIHKRVRETGRYNFEEAKIQLPSKINFDLLEQFSSDYWDYLLKSFLGFGFPLDFPRNKESHLLSTNMSPASARDHPEHIDTYLNTEIEHNAIRGPYKDPPAGRIPMCPRSCLRRR